MAILIAFYSRAGENYFDGAYRKISVGNTEKAALMLAELTGGELYKIEQIHIPTITKPALRRLRLICKLKSVPKY